MDLDRLEAQAWQEWDEGRGEPREGAPAVRESSELRQVREQVAEVARRLAEIEELEAPAELVPRVERAILGERRPPARQGSRGWRERWAGLFAAPAGGRYAYLAAGLVIGALAPLALARLAGLDPLDAGVEESSFYGAMAVRPGVEEPLRLELDGGVLELERAGAQMHVTFTGADASTAAELRLAARADSGAGSDAWTASGTGRLFLAVEVSPPAPAIAIEVSVGGAPPWRSEVEWAAVPQRAERRRTGD